MNDKIIVENYEVVATHGVNPEEKINPQRFWISLELATDFQAAAKNDDLNKTTSYATVCKRIKSFFCDNCFDLIETLAVGSARLLLKEFPLSSATVTVKKPDAPMKGKFDFVAVKTTLKWTKCYLSLGSNEGDRNACLDLAISELEKDENIKEIRESKRIVTAPYGGVAVGEFLNSAVEINTLYSAHELLEKLHEIEALGGRVRKERWGNRTLDVDILFYGDEVIEDDDLCVPHADMLNRLFVFEPLNELCPNKLHPVFKMRVCDIYKELKKINAKE